MTPTTIVCGPPGAGKSTYVWDRAGERDLVLDLDEIVRALTGRSPWVERGAILPFAIEARASVLRLLRRGFLGPARAWIIMCGDNNEERAELATALHADVVVLPTAAGECVERMKVQGRPASHIREVAAVCERWHGRFRPMPGERISFEESGREIGHDGYPV